MTDKPARKGGKPESLLFSETVGRAGQYQQEKQWPAAEAEYREALKLALLVGLGNDDLTALFNNLGMAVQNQGKLDTAEAVYREALSISPAQPEVCCNLAGVLRARGKLKEAISLYLSVLRKAPDNAVCLSNLGNACKDLGRYRDAATFYRKAIAADPGNALPWNNLGSVLSELGDVSEAVLCFRRALALDPKSPDTFSNFLLGINYLQQVDSGSLYLAHCQFEVLFCQMFRNRSRVHENVPDPVRPLRLGFVSGDFGRHPLAAFLQPVFENLEKAGSQVICYSNRPTRDEVTSRFESLSHQWRDVFGVDDATVARWVREDGIDILVDLSGHTAGNRLLVFARKPAPVSVTMAGYMATTGMSAMDYRISSDAMDPVGSSDTFYSERLVRIQALPAFAVPENSPDVAPLPAQERGYVTFASLNNMSKIGPTVLDVWAEILTAVPTSRLTVVGRTGNNLVDKLEARGVDSARIRMLDYLPMPDYLELHHQIDILLDPFPFNGGATSFIAAWMGVPIVSVAGESGQSRFGALLLKALRMEELLASNRSEYVSASVALAADIPRLERYRRELRGRMSGLLGDGSEYTRQLETAFRSMWRAWCAKA